MKSSEKSKRKGGSRRGNDAVESATGEQVIRELVARKAYELYEKRGCSDGCDVEDWLEAERLILDQPKNQPSTSKETPKGV